MSENGCMLKRTAESMGRCHAVKVGEVNQPDESLFDSINKRAASDILRVSLKGTGPGEIGGVLVAL